MDVLTGAWSRTLYVELDHCRLICRLLLVHHLQAFTALGPGGTTTTHDPGAVRCSRIEWY